MFKHQIFTDLTALVRLVYTYLVSVLVLGTIGSIIFWYRYKRGTVVIHGLHRYLAEIGSGRLVIASNHPTILESMLLLFMCWPRCLWQPRTFFPWSMPDKELFYQMGIPRSLARFLYWTSNSIPVERSGSGGNNTSYNKALRVLEKRGTLIVHPEAGRTDTPPPANQPAPRYFKSPDEVRRVRNFSKLSQIPRLATLASARILPVYVDLPFGREHNTFKKAWRAWSSGKYRISIYVGTSYLPDPKQTIEEANLELAQRILNA